MRKCASVSLVVLRGGSEFTRRGGYPPRRLPQALVRLWHFLAAGTETRRATGEVALSYWAGAVHGARYASSREKGMFSGSSARPFLGV